MSCSPGCARCTAYDDLDVIEVDDLVIDVGSRKVQRSGTEIDLWWKSLTPVAWMPRPSATST